MDSNLELFRKIRAGGPIVFKDDPYGDEDWYVERWKRVLIAVRHDRFYEPVTPYPWVDDPGVGNLDSPVASFDSGSYLSYYGTVFYWTEAHLVEDPDEGDDLPDQVFIIDQST